VLRQVADKVQDAPSLSWKVEVREGLSPAHLP
jgi:hypothetical protein